MPSNRPSPSRREFIAAGVALAPLATGLAMTPDDVTKPPAPVPTTPGTRDYPAPEFQPKYAKPFLDLTLARDFVIYCHYDLAMAEKLLAKDPALVYATVDWGGGDFETGLGGAAHLGKRDIMEFLLSRGARMDIFCAASLGLLDVVKGMIEAAPALANAKGPHGFTLAMHAKFGGAAAAKVLDYLGTLPPAGK